MSERDPTMPIRCSRCLTWSKGDANFCHRCGLGLRPMPEEELFRRTRRLIDESGKILERLSANERERSRLDLAELPRSSVMCAHCLRWRDRRRMKQAKAGKWLCFDHVECEESHGERGIVEALMEMGFDRDVAEAWMEMPIRAFNGLTPRQMIQDGRRNAVEALIAETRSGLAF